MLVIQCNADVILGTTASRNSALITAIGLTTGYHIGDDGKLLEFALAVVQMHTQPQTEKGIDR